jgi:hypothetical protein
MRILKTTAPQLDIRDIPKEPFEGTIQHKSLKRVLDISLEDDILTVGSCKATIDHQKTGYGCKRFLLCPDCGERRERLYLMDSETITCRKCAGLRYRRPNLNDESGTQVIHHEMLKIASKLQFKGSLEELIALLLCKQRYHYYSLLPRPKGMNKQKYEQRIKELFYLNSGLDEVILFKNRNWYQQYKKNKKKLQRSLKNVKKNSGTDY